MASLPATARLLLFVVVTSLTALLLSACSADSSEEDATAAADAEDSEQTTSEPSSSEEGEAAAAATRTIEHALGTAEVPADPQRVVDMGNVFHFEVAQIVGLTDRIIATTGDVPQTYDYVEFPDDLLDIGVQEYDLEAIAAADPDLIIGLDVRIGDLYDQLEQIAPTVAVGFETSADFLATGRAYADALGGEDAVAAYDTAVEDYLDRATGIGERIQAGDAPDVAIMRASTEFQRYELPGIFSGKILYEDVSLPVPEGLQEAAEAGEATLAFSDEQLGSIADPDHLFVYQGVGVDAVQQSQATIETLSENPLWDSLTAVQEDQVYSVGGHFFSGGVLAANLVLDDLERFVLSEQG
ncbi:MAG: ABC transporter substrate-binding protein [Nitriliruptoraceae bacterium]